MSEHVYSTPHFHPHYHQSQWHLFSCCLYLTVVTWPLAFCQGMYILHLIFIITATRIYDSCRLTLTILHIIIVTHRRYSLKLPLPTSQTLLSASLTCTHIGTASLPLASPQSIMSKRRHSSPIQVTDVRRCLEFDDWKAQRAAAEGFRRTEDAVYDPTTEALPDHPWYALDHELLRSTIIHMCNKLGRPIKDSQIDDPEILDLLGNLARATAIPHPSKVNVAVVGNQGVGKSSVINALLNRDLVDASASSSACTAFATIIQHKIDAKDDTDVSDLKVTFLEIAEIREFIEEHIRRYVDVYTPGGIIDNDATAQEADAANGVGTEVADDEDPEIHVSDSEFSDSELSDASESPVSNKKPQKKVSKAEQKGADTAELFFRIIFNAHRDITKEVELQNWLNDPDLEDGRFLDHCAKLASEHLAQIQAEEGGSVEYNNVKDSNLSVVRQHATTMWPLIKAVSISTGSVLLKNGIRIMDLPGGLDVISSISKMV